MKYNKSINKKSPEELRNVYAPRQIGHRLSVCNVNKSLWQ